VIKGNSKEAPRNYDFTPLESKEKCTDVTLRKEEYPEDLTGENIGTPTPLRHAAAHAEFFWKPSEQNTRPLPT
jgi:hypothetical protein